MFSQAKQAYAALRAKTDFVPEVAIVLGSGLGAAADISEEFSVYYGELGIPSSTVHGHAGRMVFGTLGGKKVVVLQGRLHCYEGNPSAVAVLPVRVAAMCGARTFILTNAAGGINPDFGCGDIMAIRDHICLAPNPLIGANDESFGPRFPDMTAPYDPELIALARSAAARCGISLKEGVYIQFTGPSFETAAEIRMAGIMGADAVGMSTAIETVALRHMGVRVLGLSFISNKACGLSDKPLSHEEVNRESERVIGKMRALLTAIVGEMQCN